MIILVTTVIDEELTKRAVQLGADDDITKPFDLNRIEATALVRVIQLLG